MAELLKEAIADAKAVREVALQNAKMALEEAFDSKIKNMLSAKLAEEIEEDVELEEEYKEDEKSEGMSYEEDDKVEEVDDSIDEDIDEEINLDELMAELEEMSYEEDEDGMKEAKDEEEVKEADDKEAAFDKLEKALEESAPEGELNESLAIGAGVAALVAAAGGMTALDAKMEDEAFRQKYPRIVKLYSFLQDVGGAAGGALRKDGKKAFEEGKKEEETNESIDIDALIAEIESDLAEGKDEEEVKEAKKKEDDEEKKKIKEELEEALSTVSTLKETISEMNLLNSKLLYCNKLFRANALTEAQKVKVVDALDKAATTGEAKLVFETLQESFAFTGVEKRAIQEGLGRASKAAGVAPKKVITESVDETVSRFQKLANINK